MGQSYIGHINIKKQIPSILVENLTWSMGLSHTFNLNALMSKQYMIFIGPPFNSVKGNHLEEKNI